MRHICLERNISSLAGIPVKVGDIGIELEIEGLHLPRNVQFWTRKSEPSLRGVNGRVVTPDEDLPDTPFEYVTTRPTPLNKLPSRLNSIYTALTSNGSEVRLTPRGSTHIHINMLEETLETVFGFLIVFTMMEPILLRLCGGDRNGNLFCMPASETGDLPTYTQRIVDWVQSKESLRGLGERGKYSCLNLDPLKSLGSLEVRCFPNTIDPNTIKKWVGWLVNIRYMARSFPDRTFQKMITCALDNPTSVIKSIFEEEPLFHACYPTNPVDLLLSGLETAYEVMRVILPMHTVEKEKQKPVVKKLTGWDDVLDGSTMATTSSPIVVDQIIHFSDTWDDD